MTYQRPKTFPGPQGRADSSVAIDILQANAKTEFVGQSQPTSGDPSGCRILDGPPVCMAATPGPSHRRSQQPPPSHCDPTVTTEPGNRHINHGNAIHRPFCRTPAAATRIEYPNTNPSTPTSTHMHQVAARCSESTPSRDSGAVRNESGTFSGVGIETLGLHRTDRGGRHVRTQTGARAPA